MKWGEQRETELTPKTGIPGALTLSVVQDQHLSLKQTALTGEAERFPAFSLDREDLS